MRKSWPAETSCLLFDIPNDNFGEIAKIFVNFYHDFFRDNDLLISVGFEMIG